MIDDNRKVMIIDASTEEAGITVKVGIASRKLAHIAQQVCSSSSFGNLQFALKADLLREYPRNSSSMDEMPIVSSISLLILLRQW